MDETLVVFPLRQYQTLREDFLFLLMKDDLG